MIGNVGLTGYGNNGQVHIASIVCLVFSISVGRQASSAVLFFGASVTRQPGKHSFVLMERSSPSRWERVRVRQEG